LGHASLRYFALAVGDENPLYVDEAYAREAGYLSVIAPPTFVCETNQYVHRAPNDDGYIGQAWDLPIIGCRMVRGGHDYEFFRPVLPRDRIGVRWLIEDISEHLSGRGGTLLVVIAAATFTNQDGEMLAHNRETLIYQPLGTAQ
jgi:acyl dehydratase